jgi:hypothetical protein
MKVPHQQFFSVFVLSLVFLCWGHLAWAQDVQSELSQKVSELNERYKPESENEAQQRRIRAGERLGEIESSVHASERTSIRDPRFEIVSHFRGADGVPFPDAHEVILEPVTDVPAEARAQRATEYWVAPQHPASRPLRCTENTTRSIQRRAKGTARDLIFDRLYVPGELAPVDTSDIYGERTTVEVYDGDSADRVSILMKADTVPCLPYRVRFTDTQAFYHKGEDALANYDKDPTSRGQMHPWVRKKMQSQRTRFTAD